MSANFVSEFANERLPANVHATQQNKLGSQLKSSSVSRSNLPVVLNSYNSLQHSQQMGRISTGLNKRLPQSNDYKAIPFASKQNSVCEFDH